MSGPKANDSEYSKTFLGIKSSSVNVSLVLLGS